MKLLISSPINIMIILGAIISPPYIAADTGEKIFQKACKICHIPGVSGAPKLGDKTAWKERNKKGLETLTHNAINGFKGEKGMMPPKGGNSRISDEEVKAAVKYILDNSM